MRRWLIVSGLLALTGCAHADLVQEYRPSPVAPLNMQGGGGEVEYLIARSGDKTTANRVEAYKLMHASCGGDYLVTQEWDAPDPAIEAAKASDPDNAWMYGPGLDRHLSYQCAPAAQPSAPTAKECAAPAPTRG